MVEQLFVARILGAFLMSFALVLSSLRKNPTVSAAIAIMGIALFLLLNSLN